MGAAPQRALLAAAAGGEAAPYIRREPVMGTGVAFVVHGDHTRAAKLVDDAMAWLRWVDTTFTTYSPDSEISRLDRGDLELDGCHPEVRWILELGRELATVTDGFFDVRATGRLDPSGVVKGWAVDRASAILQAGGCGDHLVECGGDVRLCGRPPGGGDWQVAIVHPLRLDAFCAVVRVGPGAVATSGTYERAFHVVDPHTGRPATTLASVTVVGDDLTTADAYATAALAMGAGAPAWLASLSTFDSMVIDHQGHFWSTPGFERMAGWHELAGRADSQPDHSRP